MQRSGKREIIMGTDIHIRAEVRKNGKWELVDKPVFKSCHDDKLTVEPFDGRNYNLFAMLADVRNANEGDVDYIAPISEPKDWPQDMSEGLKKEWGCYIDDDWIFAKSYLTLKEILDYDWNRTHRDVGFISRREYENSIMKGEHPSCWSGDVCGGTVVHVSEDDMRKIIREQIDSKGIEFYCKCTFPGETYAQTCCFFYEEVIPVLKSLIPEDGTSEDVRIIFGFDC